MSATDYPPRCKVKKNLANDIHCELYFLQNYFISLDFSDFESIFFFINRHFNYTHYSHFDGKDT